MAHSIDVPSELVQKWQEIVDLLAEIMHVPSALIMKVEPPHIKVFVASHSKGNPYERDEAACLDTGLYCETVMKTRRVLLVPDALEDEEWKSNPDIKLGMVSYLGFPIVWPDGEVFGTVCVLDTKKNEYGALYQRLLLQCRDIVQADLRSLASLQEQFAITATRAEEAVLRYHTQLLKTVTDNVSSMLNIVDTEGVGTFVNPAMERITGYRADELVGRVIHDKVHHTKPDGTPYPLEECPLTGAARAGKPLQGETVFVRKDGMLFPVRYTASPIFRDGRAVGTVIEAQDLSEAKAAADALQKAEAELARVSRVTTLGELATSIAHEINQPLAAIVAEGEACRNWLATRNPPLDLVREALDSIVKDGHRAGDVVQRIRQLATKAEPRRGPVDVNDVIRDMVPLIRAELQRHGVVFSLELAPGLAPMLGDRVQLQQVILNLAMNAIDAMASVADRPRRLVMQSTQPGGSHVVVAVQDSGVGVAADHLDYIFDAFFPTKPGGMGMGLSISRSIIEAHDGRLWAAPNAPHGAIFQFSLPGA